MGEDRAYLDVGLGQFCIEYSSEEQHLGSQGQCVHASSPLRAWGAWGLPKGLGGLGCSQTQASPPALSLG